MKLFAKERLQIEEFEDHVLIRWWKLTVIVIFLMFTSIIQLVFGIADELGFEYIFRAKVFHLDGPVKMIYWSVLGLVCIHLFFNRIVSLKIGRKEIIYRIGIVPGVVKRFKTADIEKIEIKTRETIAESATGMEDTSNHILRIYIRNRKRPIRIRGLSYEDASRVKEIIQKIRS